MAAFIVFVVVGCFELCWWDAADLMVELKATGGSVLKAREAGVPKAEPEGRSVPTSGGEAGAEEEGFEPSIPR